MHVRLIRIRSIRICFALTNIIFLEIFRIFICVKIEESVAIWGSQLKVKSNQYFLL